MINHPEDLVSLSTMHVKISNINKCVNLRNLYSDKNTYNSDDIIPLKNLRRIYSCNDYYQQNGNCLLQDIFKTNKLEYVYLYHNESNSNIVSSLILSENIENLKFLYVDEG